MCPRSPRPASIPGRPSRRPTPSFAPLLAGVAAAALLLPSSAAAQAETGPGAEAPTFREVVGHDFGQRITRHHQMTRYLRRLAETSPRVSLLEQGESWEGRELLAAVVTSPDNQARLAEIRRRAQRLGDPRATSGEEAGGLLDDQPVIAWFGGSIHGFELSGTEGLLKLLEHLTTRDDAVTRRALDEAVVIIDPMLNPDGRDAFAARNVENGGREPVPERDDWANDYGYWEALQFRTGHYYFDTNRDWFAHTQRETRARIGTLQAWRPQVLVDAHEMGPDVEFYFDPAAEPYGPHFPDYARRGFELFNEAYAAAFDSAGIEYMTRERYNYFYPGYTTSMGSYQGGIGMLYEQGSSRGLALTRPDGSVRTLADALEHQYVAARTAVATAVEERERLLTEYREAHEAAVERGRSGTRRYLIAPGGDPGLVAEAVNLLRRNGIEVRVLTEEASLDDVRDRTGEELGARSFPAGTYVVEAAQPRNALLRALLEPDVPLSEEFLRTARERVDLDRNPRFYDITAWSLPLLFDLRGFSSEDGGSLASRAVAEPARPAGAAPDGEIGRAGYAYLIPGDRAAALGALHRLREEGHRASVTLEPTRLEGRDVERGTVVVRTGQNDSTVHEAVREVAARYDLPVRTTGTGLAEPGYPSLGSADVIPVRTPVIGLLAEDPVHAYSFGWAWHALDRQYEIPVTVLRAGSLGDEPLHRYDVLVVPHLLSASALAGELGEGGVARLKRWVRDGGTLVAVGEAVEFAREELEMLHLRSWYEEAAGARRPDGEGAAEPAEEPEAEFYEFDVPGAFFRADLSADHWLSAGAGAELPVLVGSSRIYLPPEGPPNARRRTVATYAGTDPLLAGHAWPETLERVPGAVFLYEERVGDGRIIAFAEDPSFRGYWRGADRLFLNAVVLGPSAP